MIKAQLILQISGLTTTASDTDDDGTIFFGNLPCYAANRPCRRGHDKQITRLRLRYFTDANPGSDPRRTTERAEINTQRQPG